MNELNDIFENLEDNNEDKLFDPEIFLKSTYNHDPSKDLIIS
jgi:hypothetical protein